jgi:hypothetical protein
MFICVWHLLTAMCLFAMGCYETPDYTPTRFRCNAAHICPDNQICQNGACTGGSSATSNVVGVSCGSITCAIDQQCCLDFVSAPLCTALIASCDVLGATCDGIEDCHGNACCEVIGLDIACSGTTTCPTGQDQICLDTSDCTTPAVKQCCFDEGLPGEQWGRCRPAC